jgi:FkbM family methyltransferase
MTSTERTALLMQLRHAFAERPRFDQTSRTVRRLRGQALATPRRVPGEVELHGYSVRFVDFFSLFIEYKDIFGSRIYHFNSDAAKPRVIDGGGCIGMSVLYTKRTHPEAQITCFEPDPEIYPVLRRNVESNGLRDVELVQAGLAAEAGSTPFLPDGADGGRIVEEGGTQQVETVRLSQYLDAPVDFLKLNIEGMELPVLEEAASSLSHVRELVLEYHGWPGQTQRLGPILNRLDEAGFRYLINHYDYETNGFVRTPFALEGDKPWFALVYGKRQDLL